MAIFHLDVKNISRSQGRSVVNAAAYRAAERLFDERLNRTFDYSKKEGVVFSTILAPEHAPDWVKDRAQLWNTAEVIEKRKDARLAKEILIALPKELTLEQNVDLLKDYCQAQFIDKGMIADINIHCDNPDNPHAHILLTTREIHEAGFGLKNREWNKRELVFELRRAWQDIANTHLYLADHDTRIDCQSLKARGLDIEPNVHLGPSAHHENDFIREVDQRDILRANGDKLIQNPTPFLEKLTQQQSIFTTFEMAKLANQYSADLEQYQQVLHAIQTAQEVIQLGQDDFSNTVYSTRAIIEQEHQMLNHAYELDTKKTHVVDADIANRVIQGKTLSQGQMASYQHLMAPGDLKVMSGLAGTGKSYLMGMVREAYENAGYQLSGVALSGIAAQGLQESAGIQSATVDSQLLQWDNEQNRLTAKHILVIDEAGMLGTDKMERLLAHANAANAKVIMVHDTEQLSAIQNGAPSRAIAERFGQTVLMDVIRQKDPEMAKATVEFGTQQTEAALARYEALGAIHHTSVDESVARRLMMEAWAADRTSGKTQIMLAYTNESVKALNDAARHIRIAAKEIEPGALFTVEKGERTFAVHDRLYFLKNDRQLGVKNGTLGTIQSIEGNRFKVLLDGKESKVVSFNLKEYQSIDHGYAATIHKSQGVTVDKAYTLVSKHFDRHLTYVACTRHRETLNIYAHQQDFKNREKLFNVLSRERSKTMAVDFAEARWIKPQNAHECNLHQHPSQPQLAQERLEIKTLKTHLPHKEFSFARAYESVKGWIQGVITLSTRQEMLCIAKDNLIKLVGLDHNLHQQIGKETHLHLDKAARIQHFEMTERHQQKELNAAILTPEKSVESVQQRVSYQEKNLNEGVGL